jgi:hypothetical protein
MKAPLSVVSTLNNISPSAIAAMEMQLEHSLLPISIDTSSSAEIKGFAKALSDCPESRCRAIVSAAQGLRDQWVALSAMQPTDQILVAFDEVQFVLRGVLNGRP